MQRTPISQSEQPCGTAMAHACSYHAAGMGLFLCPFPACTPGMEVHAVHALSILKGTLTFPHGKGG